MAGPEQTTACPTCDTAGRCTHACDLHPAPDAESLALYCLGMCADWAGHPAYTGPDDAGLRRFLADCAEGLRWQRDEIGRLRVALRVNGLRQGATDAEIDGVIYGKR